MKDNTFNLLLYLIGWYITKLINQQIFDDFEPQQEITASFEKKKIVLLKSLRSCKRREKEYFTLKSNSKKIILCGGRGATLSCFRYDFNVIISFFRSLYNF